MSQLKNFIRPEGYVPSRIVKCAVCGEPFTLDYRPGVVGGRVPKYCETCRDDNNTIYLQLLAFIKCREDIAIWHTKLDNYHIFYKNKDYDGSNFGDCFLKLKKDLVNASVVDGPDSEP